MTASITIPGSVLDMIAARARAYPDEEICGAILRGEDYPVDNVCKEPSRRFRMDPEQQMLVWNEWKREGDLIIYHSHPTGSVLPSADDKWVIGRTSGVTFVIYGLKCDEFAAYRWNDLAIVGIKIERG